MERLTKHSAENLSNAQLKIVNNIDFKPGLYVVEAAAGSGKTRTLSYVVLKALLNEDIKDVFVLTATKTAKEEALARVGKLHTDLEFHKDAVCRILYANRVRTIHSICLGAAKDQVVDVGAADVEVVSSTAIKTTIEDILHELGAPEADDVLSGMPTNEAATLLTAVRAERLHAVVPVVDDSLGQTAQMALQVLETRMRCDPESGLRKMDFDQMVESFRDDEGVLAKPDDVLFVDEAQDLSRCQISIILNTLKCGACVVMLGDESQGIFQFSGACDQPLASIKQRARELDIPVTRHDLNTNHRSTNRIVKASETLLPHVDRTRRAGIKGNGIEGEPVEVVVVGEDKEAAVVAGRIVALVKDENVEPGDIVVLRHRNWGWNDATVQELRSQASKASVDVPAAIMGQDSTNSLTGKLVAALQVACGLERFCNVADEGLELVNAFLKSLRNTRGYPVLAMKTVEEVFQAHISGDPTIIFSRYKEELMSTFKLKEAEFDAAQAEKEARSGKSAKRKKPLPSNGPTRKESNFEVLVDVAARVIKQFRARLRDVEAGKTRLEPITFTGAVGVDRKKPPETSYPTLTHPLGGLVWLLLRDVVSHDYTPRDAFEIQSIVSRFDVEWDGDDVIESFAEPVAELSHQVRDRSTAGRLIFSTIHKFKGLERPAAFVCTMTPPWCNPPWPQRATLVREHADDCPNRSGEKVQCCAPFKIALDKLEAAGIAEKQRLYYVAASRAKERLFLSGVIHRGDVFPPVAQLFTNGTPGEWKRCR